MSNKRWKITHIHSTPVFYVETQIGRKPWNCFSYMSWRITFIGSTNFLCFPDATGRRLQPLVSQDTTWGKLQLPNSLATTRRRLQPPMFFGYNWKVDTTTCPCPVLPPWSRSRMMEPLSHYHCEIYHCKHVPINMNHASTCTSTCTINKCINHAPTCTKQPVINMYHKQVHPTMYQVCTNHVSTTHQPT